MKLLQGDARQILPEIRPAFILTDAPKSELEWLIEWAEESHAIVINAYAREWLKVAGVQGEKIWGPYQQILSVFRPDVVCDPYMGAGTTGIAALSLGIDFIGIERLPAKFNHARDRLNAFQNATFGRDPLRLPDDDYEESAL